jgi:ketosteroid isomerase-like protein
VSAIAGDGSPAYRGGVGANARSPKEVVRRFLDHGRGKDGWDMAVIEECFSEDYRSHTWGGDLARTAARQGRFFSAFEWLERLDTDLVAEGDLVVHRSRSRVRHVGEAFGVPATGREVTVDHVEMWRVTDGKIVEHWGGLGAGGQLHRALTVPD